MSFHVVSAARPRLNRSELAVPGSRPELFEKAARSSADVVFLDLEDAVAPDDKESARKNVIAALNDIDWTGKVMSVRINGLDTHYMYRDVIDVVEQAGDKFDLIMIPKAGTAHECSTSSAVTMMRTVVSTGSTTLLSVSSNLIWPGLISSSGIINASKPNLPLSGYS